MRKRLLAAIKAYAEPVFYALASASIIVGGIWVFSSFAYAEWIKPDLFEDPSLVLSGAIHKIGDDRGFEILAWRINVRNAGDNQVSIVAFGVTANGHHFTKLETPVGNPNNLEIDYQRYGAGDYIVPLYRKVQFTGFATGQPGTGLSLMPSESYTVNGRFLVKGNAYDLVGLFVSVGYVKGEPRLGAEPTKVGLLDRNTNILQFSGKRDRHYFHDEMQVDLVKP
jgi:hypothetical protein